jgi:hypothetical protein
MGSQPEDADIFSLCNCVTLGMPRTYTAHAMTMDMFLGQAIAGKRYPRPHIDRWPKTFIKVFKFPEVARVFLFSIFNEVYLSSYVWRKPWLDADGLSVLNRERFTMGFGDKYAELRKLSIPVPRFQPHEFVEHLIRVGEKAERIWQGVKKVILRYDLTRASDDVKEDFLRYGEAIEKAVDWPIVEVHDPNGPPARKNRPHMWCHYGERSIINLHSDILKVEANYQRRKIDV